jgi:hypothetical protein
LKEDTVMTTPNRTPAPVWRRPWAIASGAALVLVLAGGTGYALAGSHTTTTVIRPAAAAPAVPKATTAPKATAPAHRPSPPAPPRSAQPKHDDHGPTVIINNNNNPAPAAPAPVIVNPAPAWTPGGYVDGQDPGNVVLNYYADIRARDFTDAWNMGGSNVAAQHGQTYASWVAGYAGSYPQVTVTGESGGSTVYTVDVTVTGGGQVFTGYYTVDISTWTITSGYLS